MTTTTPETVTRFVHRTDSGGFIRRTCLTSAGRLVVVSRRAGYGIPGDAIVLQVGDAVTDATPARPGDCDRFTRAYLEAAFFASTTDDGKPLDRDYDPADLTPEALAAMAEDCAKFQAENADHITDANRLAHGDADASAGHDFWLTRNGHGAGFWDGDWEQPAGGLMTEAAKRYGEVYLTVDDDGKVSHFAG